MKIAAIVGLSLLFIFLAVRIYGFVVQGSELSSNYATVEAQLAKTKQDQEALDQETRYLANPANLEKELRSRFNYKKPGEKMIIIVPPASSTTSTASGN